MRNLEESLIAREMVLLKIKVDKRKQAKEIGSDIASRSKANLVQSLGHTILLYRTSNPPKDITAMLSKELSSINNEN